MMNHLEQIVQVVRLAAALLSIYDWWKKNH